MILIRKAKEEDLGIIKNIAEKTWPTAYHNIISEAQIQFMLEQMYNKGELLAQLQKGYVFLIASEAEKNVGFASFALSDPAEAIYKLHKLYVLPEMHGKSVGRILLQEVYDLVERNGAKALQLNVNRQNKATGFYNKLGFKIKETVDLNIGNGFYMNDYVMEIKF